VWTDPSLNICVNGVRTDASLSLIFVWTDPSLNICVDGVRICYLCIYYLLTKNKCQIRAACSRRVMTLLLYYIMYYYPYKYMLYI